MLDHYSKFSQRNKPLIRVQIKHLYYANQNALKMWDYLLLQGSQELIKKIGLRLQNTRDSINIWADPDKKEAFLQFLTSEDEPAISILLYPKAEFWLIMTEIPYPKTGIQGLLYFENRNVEQACLSKTSMVSEQDFFDTVFTTLSENASQSSANITSVKSRTEQNREIDPSQKSRKQILENEWQDLLHQGHNQPVAWLRIHLDQQIKKQWLLDLQKEQQLQMLSYALTFQARKVYWRYWLILLNKEDRHSIHQIQILNDLDDLRFLEPEMYAIGENSWAYVFVSEKALAISDRSPLRFQADISYKIPEKVDYEGKSYQHHRVKLPTPQLNQVYQDRSSSKPVFYADIKVFL